MAKVVRIIANSVAAAVVLLVATSAIAETIHACIAAGERTLYDVRIGTPSNCRNGDQYINWNQNGWTGQDGRSRGMKLGYPDDAFPISSDFRSRYNTIGQRRGAPHSGIDIPAPTGTPVLAMADGMVYRSRLHGKNGEEIKIKHAFGTNDEIRAQYIHLTTRLVKVGDKVRRGQIIGTVGMTGAPEMVASGVPHLHMALWTTSRRSNGGHCCRNENPHELWYGGKGSIALYRPGQDYSEYPHQLTYPLPGKNDLAHFRKKLADLK